MAVNFMDFEGRHQGETVWVLGSGKTGDFVERTFFDGKTVVAVNHAWQGKADHAYSVSNHWGSPADSWRVSPRELRVPQGDNGFARQHTKRDILVPTIEQKYQEFDAFADWPERGRFVVGPTSSVLALHWAVWLGAAHIVLVGLDCGEIDGANNRHGYYAEDFVASEAWHRLWERNLVRMAEKIRSLGVSVHSLNPWVTFNREGHEWRQVR